MLLLDDDELSEDVSRVLGRDLPGAVIVLDEDPAAWPPGTRVKMVDSAPPAGWVRFSLGGQFLKFSARTDGERVVLPVEGTGGNSLLKLPDRAYPALCELEWLTTEWARRSGINVPSQRLLSESQVEGVDRSLIHHGPGISRTLCATRFDRSTTAERIHYEDFAQVRGMYGDDTQKYAGDYAELAALVSVLCPEDLRELVRRLVFMVVSGNGDAHWKNWALVYPDGLRPRLSPAYDLLATVAYPNLQRETALDYMGLRAFAALDVPHLARIARAVSLTEGEMNSWIAEDLERILHAWYGIEPDIKLECELAFRVDDYLNEKGWSNQRRANLL